jgi:TetR/AcrR family transcriptional regulator, fatty acid biosynthesis regulator
MSDFALATSPIETIRRRMSPQDRAQLILDATARVIVEEGVSAVSMERVGREAGVSKPLVYAYFDNRANLLAQLLIREFPAFQPVDNSVDEDESVEALVRRTTLEFIDRYIAKGVLIQRLLHEPQVAENVADLQKENRKATATYFGNKMSAAFGVPFAVGPVAADILMGITGAAARMLQQDASDHDHIVDITVKMIIGASRALGTSSDT